MKKMLACALAAVLLAGCGSGSLLGNNDALAASVGSRASSAASNSVNSKINSDRIAPALNSVKAAGRNSGTDEISPQDFADFIDFYDFGVPEDAEFPSLKYAKGEWKYYLDLLDPDTGDAIFAELGFADLSLNVRKETVIINLHPRLDGDNYELYPVTDEEIGYDLFEGGFDDDGALRLSGNDVILYITDYFAYSGREYIMGETWYSEEDYGIFLMTRGQQ